MDVIETTVLVGLDDMLNFGKSYEYFEDLLGERLANMIDLDDDEFPKILSYGFSSVYDPSNVYISILYTVETF